MQAANLWLNITSRIASAQLGMGSSVNAELAFKLKRLTREYGVHCDFPLGRLSVCGTISPMDVYSAYVNCHNYKLSIVKGRFRRRPDYENVTYFLKKTYYFGNGICTNKFRGPEIPSFHVCFFSLVIPFINVFIEMLFIFFFCCDWTFIGDLEARSPSVIAFRADMAEANIYLHSLIRPDERL